MPQSPIASQSFGSVSSPESARRWRVALLTVAAFVALLELWAMSTWQRSLDPHERGTLLAGFDMSQAGGWQRIVKLDTGSPLQAAGAAIGDSVRFKRWGEPWLRHFGTDERIEVEIQVAGVVRTATLSPVPDSRLSPKLYVPGYISTWLTRWLSLLMGALLAWRRSDSPAVRGLAVSLILGDVWGYNLPSGVLREQNVIWLTPFLEDIAGMGGLWFAFQVQEDRPIWQKRPVTLLILAFFTWLVVGLVRWALQWRVGYDAPIWYSVPGLDWLTGSRGYSAVWAAIDVATVAALLWSWHRAEGSLRVRIAWITVALGGPMLWGAYGGVLAQFLSNRYAASPITWQSLVDSYISLGGALLLGWAVLRHRVFDFGLVVQRALAYSIVSTMLLAVLGIGKWVTESLLQNASQERGFIHDGAIVVAVLVGFAALQHRITKYVTRVFFRSWYEAAEALRDFVDQAAHMTDAEAMKQRFVAAVDAFTGDGGSALYTAESTGNLNLERATLTGAPPKIFLNDEVAVKLGQGARRVDLSRLVERTVGDWAFPMAVRGRICGALVIGPRTEGVSYRSEELSQLADSARTIGLNLETLRAADLQQKHDELAQQLNKLEAANKSLAAENASLKGTAG